MQNSARGASSATWNVILNQIVCDAVADIKHSRHEEALLGVRASKARLLSEAEARRKEKPNAGKEEDAGGNGRDV